MAATSIDHRLAQERRARLQAEQLLALRSEELYSANRKLAEHANELSSQVIEQREENELLKGQTSQTQAQLQVATERAVTAQRRLWDALTATEDGFAIFDRDWRLVAANPAFFEVFDGITDVSEGASYEAILRVAVDEGVVDLQGEDPDEWVDRMIARWEMTPIPRVEIKLWDGGYVRLNDKQTPQGDFVSMALDITPDIRRERKMRAARDAAMAASRAKSKFLANMSHEIRTPMNGVVSMAELLRETELDEDQQLYADTIRNSGEALLVIINDILDFSKIEAGKLELHEDSFDLNATVREIFRLLQPGIEHKDLELRLDYDIFLPERVIGDRGRVRQVLTNLIGNAVKFTENGHVTVRVLAGPPGDDLDDLNINIVVEDTGVGISDEQQAHVFGEFNQVEDEANRRHDGTGLGLAISRKLVTLMGGEMWLDSKPGRGSAFGFVIRLKSDPEASLDPVAGLPAGQSRVLLVGHSSDREEQVMDALSRLHAETSLVRRPPTVRDLEGTQAVILCDDGVAPEAVVKALDEAKFSGPRLAYLNGNARLDGFEACVVDQGLAAFRAQLVTAQPEPAPAPNQQPETAPEPSKVAEPEVTPEEIAETPGAQAPKPDHSAATPKVASADSPKQRPRLLAAEDNKTNQLVFKTMLKGLDLDIEIANNGVELVAAYKRERPDLVMTDISMPEMDGLQASGEIRAHETASGLPRARIIAMTAHALEGDKERILEAGLDDYVTKPLKKAVIHGMITEALGDRLKSA